MKVCILALEEKRSKKLEKKVGGKRASATSGGMIASGRGHSTKVSNVLFKYYLGI